MKQAFQYREALEVYAYGMLRNRAEAEDVVQDSFLVVMEKYDSFVAGTSMIGWTRAIVRRKVLQSLDRRKGRVNVVDKLLSDAVNFAFEDGMSERYADEVRIRSHRLNHCLTRIPDRSRKLLDCVYTGKMSYEGVAKSLGMNLETVRKSLYRTKLQLRECVRRTSTGRLG